MGLVNFNLQIKRKRIAFLGATKGHFAAVSMVSISMRLVPKLIFKTITFEIHQPFIRSLSKSISSNRISSLAMPR
jgi:hypothetical protein